ncbi:LysM domain-containing protein [Curvibacter sp. HBC28]|uniref:LysM domain-containing protein n=1 Tax=Curvibacter microcysteis TaxID=3026419 RepID=A0ABT5MD31_9BURK|nr:LysM domain-containing protein [Curvibacter sp. HBC28]MDD0813874.1 LysM domain-containing protein [Curvibacter sp. HBC28]
MDDHSLPTLKLSGLGQDARRDLLGALRMLNSVHSGLHRPWRMGIMKALDDPTRWGQYDGLIQDLVREFQERLHPTRMPPLDWHLIKAMLWTETGGEVKHWYTNPMQIGLYDDPGIDVVLGGKEKIDLILPPAARQGLSREAITTDPVFNLRAGLAYLLNRLALSELRTEAAPEAPVVNDVVRPGDTWPRMASRHRSSVDHLHALNPTLNTALQPGQAFRAQCVRTVRVITGWRDFTPETLALYNGRGDPMYAQKIRYVVELLHLGHLYGLMS